MEALELYPPSKHPEFYDSYSAKAMKRATRKYLRMLTQRAQRIEDDLVEAANSSKPSATPPPDGPSTPERSQSGKTMPVGTTLPVGGSRRKKPVAKGTAPSTPREPLEKIHEDSSEAEESWEEVLPFDNQKGPDVEMTSESEDESTWKNQGELEAVQYLTTLYNQLLVNQQLTPEIAYNTMLEQMETQEQLAMLHRWDQAGRQA